MYLVVILKINLYDANQPSNAKQSISGRVCSNQKIIPRRYASLTKALGNTATYELVSHTVKTSSVNDLEMLGNLLKLECEKLTKLGNKFARLNPGMLCNINASISVPDACEEAANWIAETSGSGKTSVANLKKILMDFITTNNNLRTFDEILLLHSRVAPDATSQPRGILYNGSPLPSSYAGRALFQN